MKLNLLFIFFLIISPFSSNAQEVLESSPLPIVVINTQGQNIPDDPRIQARMGIITNEDGNRNLLSDPFNEYDGRISIEIRGSSSQLFPKKGYGLETQMPDGSNRNVSLLGMPKENDWILHGPFSDKSLLRNHIAFSLGAKLSQYVPRTRLVELILNEDYQGVYILMEKIKRDNDRVDIQKLSPTTTSADSISGGYIIKLDKGTGSGGFQGWHSQSGSFFQYDYPDSEDINAAQQAYIQSYVDSMEEALFSPFYQDTETGYRKYLDEESFIDYILLNELSRNVDGYRLSTFFHKERGGKLKAGPIWDYNLAFGNANYCAGGGTFGWALNFNQICPGDGANINNYWDRLLTDPAFGETLGERWSELRNGSFHEDSIMALIDNFQLQMDDAVERNFNRWPVLGTWIWPNVEVAGSYQGEIEYLKDWIMDRLDWMDQNMPLISKQVVGVYSRPSISVFPNPFENEVTLNVTSTISDELILEVLDLRGKLVRELEIVRESGFTLLYQWDGKSSNGTDPGSGIYLYRLRKGDILIENGKLIRK